jgi:hypothetical protein
MGCGLQISKSQKSEMAPAKAAFSLAGLGGFLQKRPIFQRLFSQAIAD